MTPLHDALSAKDESKLDSLLENSKIEHWIEEHDSDGMLPLHLALRNGVNVKYVKKMLLINPTIHHANAVVKGGPFKGFTPLHLCCRFGAMYGQKTSEAATTVIQYGASVTQNTEEGDQPLHVCAKFGSVGIARLLIEDHGVDINCRSRLGITPLMYSASQGRQDVVDLLIEQDDLQIQLRDSFGDNALHHTFQFGMQRLIPNGIDIPPENESIAYVLVRSGIDIHALPDDRRDYSAYCSSALKAVLTIANSHPEYLPHHLDALLALSNEKMITFHLPPRILGQLITAVDEYRMEIADILEKKIAGGSCPVSLGNRHVLIRQGEKKNKEEENIGSDTRKQDSMRCPLGFTEKDGPLPDGHRPLHQVIPQEDTKRERKSYGIIAGHFLVWACISLLVYVLHLQIGMLLQ